MNHELSRAVEEGAELGADLTIDGIQGEIGVDALLPL
jgi:hypothetical protein